MVLYEVTEESLADNDFDGVGSGSRYTFETKDVGPMKTRFETWRKARDEAKAETAKEATTEDTPAEEPKRTTRTRKATPTA